MIRLIFLGLVFYSQISNAYDPPLAAYPARLRIQLMEEAKTMMEYFSLDRVKNSRDVISDLERQDAYFECLVDARVFNCEGLIEAMPLFIDKTYGMDYLIEAGLQEHSRNWNYYLKLLESDQERAYSKQKRNQLLEIFKKHSSALDLQAMKAYSKNLEQCYRKKHVVNKATCLYIEVLYTLDFEIYWRSQSQRVQFIAELNALMNSI